MKKRREKKIMKPRRKVRKSGGGPELAAKIRDIAELKRQTTGYSIGF